MDLDKLTTADKVIAGSAILLLIFSFFPWFKVSVEGFGSESGNGWDVGFLWAGVPVLLGLAMLAYVIITRFSPQTRLPAAPWGVILLAAGALAALLVLLKLLIGEDDEGLSIVGVEVSRSFGLFLATLAALGLAAGGFLKYKEEPATTHGATGPGTAPPTPF